MDCRKRITWISPTDLHARLSDKTDPLLLVDTRQMSLSNVKEIPTSVRVMFPYVLIKRSLDKNTVDSFLKVQNPGFNDTLCTASDIVLYDDVSEDGRVSSRVEKLHTIFLQVLSVEESSRQPDVMILNGECFCGSARGG